MGNGAWLINSAILGEKRYLACGLLLSELVTDYLFAMLRFKSW